MRSIPTLLPLASILVLFAFTGCEGDEGPAGPPGPPGPPGGTSEFTYLGGGGQACLHCHAATVGMWETTGHESAYADLDAASRQNLYCLKCHTVGFDSKVAFGETSIKPENRGPDVDGFDDYFGVDTPQATARRALLLGVQCESCHGPMGPDFNGHRPLVSFATHSENGKSLSLCYPCHETQLEEWVESGHGGAQIGSIEAFNEEHYAHNASCDFCHTSEGFIRKFDPAYAGYEFPEEVSFIGCVTCHDPHVGAEGGGNEYQLRALGAVEVNYDLPTAPGDPQRPRMEGYGAAQLCAQCHRARRDNANVTNQIANGTTNFGPHGSPQMDMFIGAGAYQIAGFEYDRTHAHQTIVNACVKCHMVRVAEIHGQSQDHAFHNFEPDVGNCAPCHTGVPDFDIDGFQSEIDGLMNTIADRLGYADAAAFFAGWNSRAAGVSVWEREVAYAMYFVNSDGSRGAHNPDYAKDLLQHALTYANRQEQGGKAGESAARTPR